MIEKSIFKDGANKNLTHPKQQKGITLIALIITIILLLILAVVAIKAVQGDAIISHAKNSATKYSAAQTAEQMQLLEYEYELQKAKGETTSSKAEYVLQKVYGDTIKIGTKVAYDAGVEGYEGEWAVLGVENGQLMLLSQSIGTLTLTGAEGYNNGVDLLDGMADDYGNGKGAVKARSLRVEDINNITGYNPAKVDVTQAPYCSGTLEEYGNKVTFEVKNSLVVKKGTNGTTNDGVDKPTTFRKLNGEALVNNSGEKYTVTNNYYDYVFGYKVWDSSKNTHITEDAVLPNKQVFKAISENLHKFLNNFAATGTKCWLANQSILGGSKSASWGIMSYTNDGFTSTVFRDFLYNSNAEAGSNKNGLGSYERHVCAVVYLEPGIELVDTNNDGIYEI